MTQLALTFEDRVRLGKQHVAVRAYMLSLNGQETTLAGIEDATGAPQASGSARLRDINHELKKRGLCIQKRRAGPGRGLHLYSVGIWEGDP